MVKIEELPPDVPPNQNAPRQEPGARQPEEDVTPSMKRLRRWIEEDSDAVHQIVLMYVSQRTGYRKWVVFWWTCFIVGVAMARTPFLASFICNAISVASYAMKGTLTALAYRQWDEVGNWLIYWIVFQAVSCLDFLADRNPLYLPAKTAALAYFHLPPLFGARYFRRLWIDPVIYDAQRDIATVMRRAHPWLLKHVYEIDLDSLNRMDEQQVHDHVQLKRLNFWRWIIGQPPIIPPPAATTDSGLVEEPPSTDSGKTAEKEEETPTDTPKTEQVNANDANAPASAPAPRPKPQQQK